MCISESVQVPIKKGLDIDYFMAYITRCLLVCKYCRSVVQAYDLGLCTKITHDIKTLTDEPVVSQPYRVPKALEPEVKKIIKAMLDKKLIQKSNSEYSSPVVLIEKPDKTLRFCVNYQQLHAISKKRTFPLSNPDELLAK